jgi:hypothetical protein
MSVLLAPKTLKVMTRGPKNVQGSSQSKEVGPDKNPKSLKTLEMLRSPLSISSQQTRTAKEMMRMDQLQATHKPGTIWQGSLKTIRTVLGSPKKST